MSDTELRDGCYPFHGGPDCERVTGLDTHPYVACPHGGCELPANHAVHVPTPDELDRLLSDISAAGYASDAVEVVENWTRKWWGVESAFTTKWETMA